MSLDDWDMRSGRNMMLFNRGEVTSLDDWDMRSGRNALVGNAALEESLDDWDMRSGRNQNTDGKSHLCFGGDKRLVNQEKARLHCDGMRQQP